MTTTKELNPWWVASVAGMASYLDAAAIAMIFAAGPATLYAAIPALGFAVGADLPVSLAMISEEAPADSKGKMITFSHILWMAGMLFAVGLGAVFGESGRFGGQMMYTHLAVVAVIVIILRSTLPESKAWLKAHSGDAPAEATGRVALKELFSGRYLLPLIGTSFSTL